MVLGGGAGYAAYWYCSGHQISTGVSEADQLLSSTDGIHSNTIGGTGSTQPYYGSINGSPSAYGLQRAACIYVYGNDQNNISTSSGTTLVNCLNHLGGFSGAEIMKKNGTTWGSYQQNAIKGLTAIRAAFCSKVGSSLGHTLLLETYSTSWDQFLVYDPYYMQREWVDADDVFSQDGFSLSWRSDTFVFEVCVYKDF